MDALIGFSGLFAAASISWIVVGLLAALVLGTLAASLFGAIFYALSRLARAVSAAADPEP